MIRPRFAVSAPVVFALMVACTPESGPPEVFRETNGSIAYDADNDGFADVGVYQQPDVEGSADDGMFVILYGGVDGLVSERRSETSVKLNYGSTQWIGDINGDGYADAAIYTGVANQSSRTMVVFGGPRDTPAKTVEFRCQIEGEPDTYGSKTGWVGDLNADGIDDVVVATRDQACVWAGASELTGNEPDQLVTIATNQNFLGVGDIDGDGHTDIAGIAAGGTDLLSDRALLLPTYPGYGASDTNGDGNVDILTPVNSYLADVFVLYESDATGFESARPDHHELMPTYQGTIISSHVHLGDVNGDGAQDVGFSNPFLEPGSYGPGAEGSISMLYGGNDGLRTGVADPLERFEPSHEFIPDASQVSNNPFVAGNALGIGDINGDGFGDLGFETRSGGVGWIYGSSNGFESPVMDGYVIVNRTAPGMAVTGPGALP